MSTSVDRGRGVARASMGGSGSLSDVTTMQGIGTPRNVSLSRWISISKICKEAPGASRKACKVGGRAGKGGTSDM